MAYQRADEDGRMYIWMGVSGLHMLRANNTPGHNGVVLQHNDPVSLDNAKAIYAGVRDFLKAEGYLREGSTFGPERGFEK